MRGILLPAALAGDGVIGVGYGVSFVVIGAVALIVWDPELVSDVLAIDW